MLISKYRSLHLFTALGVATCKMGNTQALESSGKFTSSTNMKDDSPMPLRDELEERFAQLVVM